MVIQLLLLYGLAFGICLGTLTYVFKKREQSIEHEWALFYRLKKESLLKEIKENKETIKKLKKEIEIWKKSTKLHNKIHHD